MTGTAACSTGQEPTEPPGFGPVTASFLTDEFLQVEVEMTGEPTLADLRAYADCAAAEAILLNGPGYAQHIRTLSAEEAGITRADAVYTVSRTRPDGPFVIDADAARQTCKDQGIPGV